MKGDRSAVSPSWSMTLHSDIIWHLHMFDYSDIYKYPYICIYLFYNLQHNHFQYSPVYLLMGRGYSFPQKVWAWWCDASLVYVYCMQGLGAPLYAELPSILIPCPASHCRTKSVFYTMTGKKRGCQHGAALDMNQTLVGQVQVNLSPSLLHAANIVRHPWVSAAFLMWGGQFFVVGVGVLLQKMLK